MSESDDEKGYVPEEAKQSIEDYLVTLLRRIGVKARVVQTQQPSLGNRLLRLIGGASPEATVELTGRNIGQIRLIEANQAASGGATPAEIELLVALDRPLTREGKKALRAKSEAVRGSRKPGLSDGGVTDIEWVGDRTATSPSQDTGLRTDLTAARGGIAASLNQDTGLRTELIAAKDGFDYISIRPEGESAVNIRIALEHAGEGLSPRAIATMTDHFASYDRIAEHARRLARTY